MVFTNGESEKDESKPIKRISTPAGQRLSVILENKDGASSGRGNVRSVEGGSTWQSESTFAPPTIPERSAERKHFRLPSLSGRLSNASNNGFYGLDSVPSNDTETKPYNFAPSIWSEPPAAESLPTTFSDKVSNGIRRRREAWTTHRGGWRRMALIIGLLILLAIGLGVGLGVGLKHSTTSTTMASSGDDGDHTSGDEQGPDHSGGATDSPPGQFPAGKWAISTFLDTVQTDCTSEPATWECFPYVTYYENESRSRAIFNWIIDQDPDSSEDEPSYSIRSSSNPFSIAFPRMHLKVYDRGTDDERYTFQFTTQKRVYPDTPLTNDHAATVCIYSTNFQATLYGRKDKSVDLKNQVQRNRRDYTPWPYMASIEQTSTAGDGVSAETLPQCFRSVDGTPTGDQLDIRPAKAGGVCNCYYRDWLTPSR